MTLPRFASLLYSLALLPVAFAAAPAPAAAADAAPLHTTLAIPANNFAFIDGNIAADEGFWKKENLEVTQTAIAGVGSTNAVIAGSMDFAFASGPTVTRANARGQKLMALAATNHESDQNILIRKEIADAAHFDPDAPLAVRARIYKGLTIATGGAGAIPDLVLKVEAKEAGLAPDDVAAPPMATTEFLAAFQRKAVGGFVSGPPFDQIVRLDGTGVLVSDTTKGEPTQYAPLPSALIIARADFCPQHRAVCTALLHGITEASRFFQDRPAETLAVMKRHFPNYSDAVLKASYEELKRMMSDPPLTTPQELENADNLDVAAGFMKASEKLPDYAAIIDNEFVK